MITVDVEAELAKLNDGGWRPLRPAGLGREPDMTCGTAVQDVTAAQTLYAAAPKNSAGRPLPPWEWPGHRTYV
ncbi:hypothetical protein [Streptosporangium subroseum]|uniref:hypothetical protein n=1 Tax=Streptosporangium subroseum TaxID=106412 RepID=UPI0030905BED|nr:hypothetical protein OHB15_38285 [Streptosporangium subroseum]